MICITRAKVYLGVSFSRLRAPANGGWKAKGRRDTKEKVLGQESVGCACNIRVCCEPYRSKRVKLQTGNLAANIRSWRFKGREPCLFWT